MKHVTWLRTPDFTGFFRKATEQSVEEMIRPSLRDLTLSPNFPSTDVLGYFRAVPSGLLSQPTPRSSPGAILPPRFIDRSVHEETVCSWEKDWSTL